MVSRRVAAVWAAAAVTLAGVSAQGSGSECGSGAAAAAVAFAVLFLLSLGVLGFVLYKYVWKPRHSSSLEKAVLAENGQDESRFAFDNPYFEADDDIGNKSTLPSNDVLAASEKTGTTHSTDSKAAKKTPWSPFAVFSSNPKPERRRAFDDTFLSEPERVSVPLRGHDFTGLGFNICGNMREGIFVKDVLHRGPASESGQVRAGDRITGISVSFSHVVFEDALTILSYASPYDVQLHLEKDAVHNAKKAPVTSQPSSASERLVHPFYRSQSIDDLTKIGRKKLHSAKQSARTTIYTTSEAAPTKLEGSLTPKASSFNEKLLSKTPPAPRIESARLAQRDHLAVTLPDSSAPVYREMAVDVSDDELEKDAKRKAAETFKFSRLGVKVLPDVSVQITPGTITDPESSSASGELDRAETAGVSTVSVQSETKAPSGGAVSPGARSSDDGDQKGERSKFKMGISGFGFKKQKAPKVDGLDGRTDAGEDVVDTALKVVEAEDRSKRGGISGINVKLPKFGGSKPVFENEKYVKKNEEEDVEAPQPLATEVEKLKSAMNNTGVSARKQSGTSSASSSDVDAIEVDTSIHTDGSDKKDSKSKPWGLKGLKKGLRFGKKSDSDEKDRKTSSSSSSGEENKELQADIPIEMKLAAGVAQERRTRRARHISGSSSSSDEDKKRDKKSITPQPIEVEVKVADKPLSSMSSDKTEVEENVEKLVRKVDSDVENLDAPRGEMDKIEVLKEVLSMTPNREVRPKQFDDSVEDEVSETVERSTVQRRTDFGSADNLPRFTGEITGMVEVGEKKRQPADPASSGRHSSRRSSDDDDGDGDDDGGGGGGGGGVKQRRAKKLRKRRSGSSSSSSSSSSAERAAASSDDETGRKQRLFGLSAALPLSSTELSVDTSSTEPLNTSTPVKRPAGDERDRKCASMGDLYRLELPAAPDSPPLERAVSLELRNAEMEPGMKRSDEQAQVCLQEPQLDLSRVGRSSAQWTAPGDRVLLEGSSGLDGRTQIEVVTVEQAPRAMSTVVMLNQSHDDVTVISTDASTSGQWVTAEEGDTVLAQTVANGSRRSSTSSSSSGEPRMEIDEGTQTSAEPLDLDISDSNYVSVSSVAVGDDTLVAPPGESVGFPSVEQRYTSSAMIGGSENVTYVTSAEFGAPSSLVEVVGDVVITGPEADVAGIPMRIDIEENHHEPSRSRKSSTSSSSSSSSSSSDEQASRRKFTVTNELLEVSPVASPTPEIELGYTSIESTSLPQADSGDPDLHKAPLLREDSKTRLLQTVMDAHEIKLTTVQRDRRNSNSTSPLSVEVASLIPPPARPRQPASAASPTDREVIEISEDELDAVMLSHRDYLLRQAERLSQSPRSPPADADEPWRVDADAAGDSRENGDVPHKGRRAEVAAVGSDGAVSTTLIIGGAGAVTATVIADGPESPPPDLQPPPE